jgi:hypothetical protein
LNASGVIGTPPFGAGAVGAVVIALLNILIIDLNGFIKN